MSHRTNLEHGKEGEGKERKGEGGVMLKNVAGVLRAWSMLEY